MRSLRALSEWLLNNKFKEEYLQVLAIQKVASSLTYTVKGGDTLSGIASSFGVSVSSIQQENDMGSKTAIFEGQKLTIRKRKATDDEVVAMTLLGEGGTLKGVPIMREVFSVIKNRAECRGMTLREVVEESSQFSYWNSKSPDTVLYGDMGKKHKLFPKALRIVQNEEVSKEVGASTHYYVFNTKQVSKEHRNYEVKPNWADENNPNAKWTEIYKGSHHVYGIDRSNRHYKNCPR